MPVFDVVEYEATHGPIETWDYEAYEYKRRNKRYKEMEKHNKLRQQQVLGTWALILAVVSALLTYAIPEMHLVAFCCICLGAWLLTTEKIVIY